MVDVCPLLRPQHRRIYPALEVRAVCNGKVRLDPFPVLKPSGLYITSRSPLGIEMISRDIGYSINLHSAHLRENLILDCKDIGSQFLIWMKILVTGLRLKKLAGSLIEKEQMQGTHGLFLLRLVVCPRGRRKRVVKLWQHVKTLRLYCNGTPVMNLHVIKRTYARYSRQRNRGSQGSITPKIQH